MGTYVLFHRDCADGTAAALAAYQYFGDSATYISCQYQEDPPELPEGSEVYLVDFSYPKEILEQLTNKHKVTVLDHHKTAKEALLGLGSLKDKVFDLERSGAMITWQYFFPNEVIPKLFYFIQDRDLWLWEHEETRPVSAYLATLGFNDFTKWIPLLKRREVDKIIEKGEAICEYQDKCVENNIKKFYWGELPDGTGIWMTNNTHLISETCNTFLKQNEDIHCCCCWFIVEGTKIVYSLRGDGQYDCSKLAKRFGGEDILMRLDSHMNINLRIEKIVRDEYFDHHEPDRKLPKCYYITIPNIAKVYIRDKGVYNLLGQTFKTLTLANIEVEEQYRDQGIGSIILDTLIDICPYSVFIVECVHSPVLRAMLLKRGFTEDPNLPQNYYLFLS